LFNITVIARQSNEIVKLCSELVKYSFQCTVINSSNAIEQVEKQAPKLLLVEFTGSSDIETLCRYLRREKNLPIIALSPPEKIESLGIHIDDFVAAPYNIKELATRIKRLIQRKTDVDGEQISIGDLTINKDKYEVYVNDRPISLTFKEYELLKYLASHAGRVFARDALLNQVWGRDYFGGDRTVDVHIRRVRSKIEDPTHNYIETVRNIGYRFIKK